MAALRPHSSGAIQRTPSARTLPYRMTPTQHDYKPHTTMPQTVWTWRTEGRIRKRKEGMANLLFGNGHEVHGGAAGGEREGRRLQDRGRRRSDREGGKRARDARHSRRHSPEPGARRRHGSGCVG
jgi:hypothetical protein